MTHRFPVSAWVSNEFSFSINTECLIIFKEMDIFCCTDSFHIAHVSWILFHLYCKSFKASCKQVVLLPLKCEFTELRVNSSNLSHELSKCNTSWIIWTSINKFSKLKILSFTNNCPVTLSNIGRGCSKDLWPFYISNSQALYFISI